MRIYEFIYSEYQIYVVLYRTIIRKYFTFGSDI